MIADDPRVVFEMIEQIDHQRALVSKAHVGALIYVADIDQDRVGIFTPPAPDLRCATRQSAPTWISVVVGGWQDMPVQVRRVQDRNTKRVGIERSSGLRKRRDSAEQSRLAGEFQELSPSPITVCVKHRLLQWADILASHRSISQ